MKFGLFREGFLAQSATLPLFADGFAKDFSLVRDARHETLANQQASPDNHTQQGCICACLSLEDYARCRR